MIESPKDPPRGDFSAEFEVAQQQPISMPPPPIPEAPVIEEPIDVNIQGDTSKVFYDYDPDEANEIVILETLAEESPKSEDIPMTALPEIPVPMKLVKDTLIGTEQETTTSTTTAVTAKESATVAMSVASNSEEDYQQEQDLPQPPAPAATPPVTGSSSNIPTSTSSSSTSSNEDGDKNR